MAAGGCAGLNDGPEPRNPSLPQDTDSHQRHLSRNARRCNAAPFLLVPRSEGRSGNAHKSPGRVLPLDTIRPVSMLAKHTARQRFSNSPSAVGMLLRTALTHPWPFQQAELGDWDGAPEFWCPRNFGVSPEFWWCPRNSGVPGMKKVVSVRPTRAFASPGRCRPCGYNLVELSRFAVGIHPLVFESLAGSCQAVIADPFDVIRRRSMHLSPSFDWRGRCPGVR